MTKEKTITKEQKLNDYDSFVDKFKQKLTTDDCYTPDLAYEVVADYVASEYGMPREKMIRPFWPGADYTAADYSNGAVVVDNPPFSILAKILDFYLERKIPFFLFAPSLTVFNYTKRAGVTAVITRSDIVYENGAEIGTSFLTNLSPEFVAVTCPRLHQDLNNAIKQIKKNRSKQLPKYTYPRNLITVSMLKSISSHDIKIRRNKSHLLRTLDAQKAHKKSIYGCGLLVSENIAAAVENAMKEKKQVAEKDGTALVWELSARELELLKEVES